MTPIVRKSANENGKEKQEDNPISSETTYRKRKQRVYITS